MKKIMTLLLTFVLLFSTLAGCGKASVKGLNLYTEGMPYTKATVRTPADIHKVEFEFIGKDVMPIGGFYGPYASGGSMDGNDFPNYLTDKVFGQLQAAGVNCIVYTIDRWATNSPNPNLKKAFALGEEYGIGYFVDSYSVMSRVGEHTKDVDLTNETWDWLEGVVREISDNGNNKAFLGIHDMDEPFTKQLDNLESFRKAFYSLDFVKEMGYHTCTDVLGYWDDKNDLFGTDENITYDEYMTRYMGEETPKFLSATQYPFAKKNDEPLNYADKLFGRLSIYRKYCQQYKVPLWRMMQAGGQWNDRAEWIESVDPYPSEGEFLLDFNTSLAYGAKGIQFFPLIQPTYYANQTGGGYDFENRNSLIAADGNLTRWYYYAKRANEQVQAIDHVLMNAESDTILVHGPMAEQTIFEYATHHEGVEKAEVGYYELQEVTGDDCIIGCFNYLGRTALYVVNTNVREKADISLKFDKDNYLFEVIQRGVSNMGVGGNVNLKLDTGEGALVVLN